MALLEKAAGQGHAYAMWSIAFILLQWMEQEQAVPWYTKAAEAGLPKAMFSLGLCFDKGDGMAAPDYPAAASWYRRAADTGHWGGASNLSSMYRFGRGRAWQTLPATSPFTFEPYFIDSKGVTCRGERYLPDPRPRRHA